MATREARRGVNDGRLGALPQPLRLYIHKPHTALASKPPMPILAINIIGNYSLEGPLAGGC